MGMRPSLARKLAKVAPLNGAWMVQLEDGGVESFGAKDEAKAAANQLARATQDAGPRCRVDVHGELGFVG
ncbi:MAG: hypothetical protein CGW95_04325 [Phenylobacterium zucineum]|nr:MAG: hypothetical protein CGW95_04325 [Phenylobacterium zucineum]